MLEVRGPKTPTENGLLAALAIGLLLSWSAAPARAEITNTSFELTDHRGKRLSDMDLRGKHLLVFFGYTYCPDICPVALTNIAETLDHLGENAKKVTPIFVTLDPQRDTPEQLAGYVPHFHPTIIGLTGSADMIKQMATNYAVTYDTVTEGDDYLINHSGGVYVIDPSGAYLGFFDFDEPPEAVANTIGEMLSGAGN